MKQPIYTIGSRSFGFSLEAIRRNYLKKEDFYEDVIRVCGNTDKAKLKKVLSKVWDEAFPDEGNNQKGAK